MKQLSTTKLCAVGWRVELVGKWVILCTEGHKNRIENTRSYVLSKIVLRKIEIACRFDKYHKRRVH